MCGILGGVGLSEPQSFVDKVSQSLYHRGPDDFGLYINNHIVLAHRRLSIIDLTSGHQPMCSSDQNDVLVYNGEIYNFREIKKELETLGYTFNTTSDTEVILVAYRHWGYECLNKFNGMFAFALWDNVKQSLWLVRDRIGVKPLYYYQHGNCFYFASEGRALLNIPHTSFDYDLRAVDQYITYRYVPGNRSFYKGIHKLPQATWMIVGRDGKIIKTQQWWDFPRQRNTCKANTTHTYKEQLEEFNELFASAVKLRMVSDVPVGLFLSSGIDSASIAKEMSKTQSFECFTLGFNEKIDEISTARQISDTLGCRHTPYLMSIDDFDLLSEAVSVMDEPYGDSIILPTYLLAKVAAKEVKVVLTGDGADETMCGYIHHNVFSRLPENLPPVLYRTLGLAVRLLPPPLLDFFFQYPASAGRAGRDRLSEFLQCYPDILQAYLCFTQLFTAKEKDLLYSDNFKEILKNEPDEIGPEMELHFNQKLSPLDLVLQWEMKTWFPNQTLMKLDRLSMAHSLEGRCPFADYRIVEYLLSVPTGLFSSFFNNKNLLRTTYSTPFLPKKKKAFYFPVHGKFSRKFTELINAFLTKSNAEANGLFNYSYIQSLFSERAGSPLLTDKKLMAIIILVMYLNCNKGMK